MPVDLRVAALLILPQFLMPAIDMVNHAKEGVANTRRYNDDEYVFVYAERPIKQGEQVCHVTYISC